MKPSSVYFIDSRISLADRHLLTDSLNEESIWYLVDEEKDGLSQIRDILIGYSGLDSLHLVSHGSPGSLLLGASVINNATLINQGALMAAIGQSLNERGDLLIYGCNVASGSQGRSFIQQISELTKADIAASTDQTGLLGNWELEYRIGAIEAAALNISTFDEALSLPTVSNLKTTNTRPTLSGLITLTAGRTVEVEVAGSVYKSGDGNLSIDNLARTWKLALPVDLAVGNYDVQVRIVDAPPTSGEINSNPSFNQISGVQRQIRTGVEVSDTVSVTANKLYNSTKAAEIFQVGKNTSALIFAGNGDTIDLSGRITDYTFTSVGNQLKINDGLYTTTISVGGALKLRTASGSTEVVYENVNSIIKVGGQNVADSSFNRLNAISSTANKSANAQSIIKDLSVNEIQIITEGGAWTPTIQHVTLSNAAGAQNGILNANDVVTASITFDGIVSVTGVPQLGLLLGGKKVSASYNSGSGSNTLTFNYTIKEGDTDSNGISVLANSLSLNGGTINASLNYESVPDNSQFLVDTRIPVLTSGHVPTTGSVLELNFSEVVAAGSGNIVITKIPGLGASVVNGFATTNGTINSGGVLYATNMHVADIDPTTASFVLGGGNINSGNGIAGSAIQVTRSSGVLDFWVVTYDGGYTKAVKVEMVDTTGGILVKQLDARYKTGNYVTDSTVNWSTASAGTVVTSNSASGYGLSSFMLAEVVTAGTGTYTIAVTDSAQVSIFGSSVNITPTAGLPIGAYTVTYAAGTLTDQSGNVSPAIQAFQVTPSKISLGGITSITSTTDRLSSNPFAQATVSESLSTDYLTAKITFKATNGTLSGLGLNLPEYSNGQVTYEFKEATASALQSQLRSLIFTPTPNQVAAGETVQTDFDIVVNGGQVLSTNPIVQIASQFIGTRDTTSPDYANNIWDTNPVSIATDYQGNVWVAYNDNDSIIKFSSSGQRLLKIKDPDLTSHLGNAQSLISITTDSQGNVYGVSRVENKVVKFSPSGEKLMTLTQGMNFPEDAVVDQQGNIWVTNSKGNSLQKFSASGELLLTLTDGLSGPLPVVLDGLGNIWVGNLNSGTLVKFSPSGERLQTIQQQARAQPLDIVVDSQNNIWVANDDANYITTTNVVKYSASGDKLLTLTEGIYLPKSLAIDGDDNLWVANNYGNTIYRYTSSGEVFSTKTWTTCCHISKPQCVAIDNQGNAWVGNNWTSTIQKFGLSGQLFQDSAHAVLNVVATEATTVADIDYVSPSTIRLLTDDVTDGLLVSSIDITKALVSNNGIPAVQISNASKLGAFIDGSPSVSDIVIYNINGTPQLLSHGIDSAATTAGAVTLADVSSDGRYVVMATNNAASFGPSSTSRFVDSRSDYGTPYSDLIIVDCQTGMMALASHADTINRTVGYQISYVDMSADNKYIVMQTPWAGNYGGFVSSGGASNDILVYSIETGDLRLVTHTTGSAVTPAKGAVNNVLLTHDGKYVLFTANNASLFSDGPGGIGNAFLDSATGKSDLFAANLETGNISLLSNAGTSKITSAGSDNVAYVGQSYDGRTVYFETNNVSLYGLSGGKAWNLVANDLATNTNRLVSAVPADLTASASTNFSAPAVWESGFAVTRDQHYVAFVSNMGASQLSATNSNWSLDSALASSTKGYVLLVADTTNGSLVMANHSDGKPNMIGQQIMRDANGFVSIKGFSSDGTSLVFETSYGKDFGFASESLSDRAIVAYDLATGGQRLLSHSADPTQKVQGASASYLGMTGDTNWLVFSAKDASKFGNDGKPFYDSNPLGVDLFAVHVKTGEISLLSGSDGISNGGINSYTGLSEDGNTAYFTATNVSGMKTAQGTLIDNNLSGADLVSVRLNLLDLVNSSDSAGQIAGDGSIYDNVTALKSITLNSILTPNTSAQLFDDFNGSRILVGATTADASGNASWNLSNVASGNHHYTLWSPAEQLPILLSGNHAASSLDVRVL